VVLLRLRKVECKSRKDLIGPDGAIQKSAANNLEFLYIDSLQRGKFSKERLEGLLI